MGAIVLLSGPVGAGKSTIAKELVALSAGAIAYIEGDVFWPFIAKGGKTLGVHKNFKMIMTAMVAAALPMARYDYEVIVDFSIPPWFLDTVHRVVKEKVPVHYIVLRPSLAVCMQRAATRAEGTIADYSRFGELYTSFDVAQKNIIADDLNNAGVVAGHVRQAIDEGMFII